MSENESRFTVFFEDPFWIGVYEKTEGEKLRVCKITFGVEPKEGEVYEFLLENWHKLVFSPPVKAGDRQVRYANPKRVQRAIGKQLGLQGVGTKAQEAIKLAQQEGKETRRSVNRKRKELEQQEKFERRQEKKKQKHKGR